MDYVSGEPERLEAFAPEAARLVDSLRGDVADYQQALADFASQPSDLPTPDLSDRGARVEELTGELERLGHELTVFAEALRDADAAAMAHGSQPVPGGLGAVTVTGGAAGRLMESVEERLRDTDRPADLLGPWGAALVRTGGRVGLARNLARSGAHATRLVETQARLARLRTDLAGTPHRLGYESAQGFRHRVAQNRALARDELARARVGRADTFRDLRHNNPIARAPSRLANTRVAGLLRGGSKALGPIGVGISALDFGAGVMEGDTEQMVTGGLATAGGVMVAIPGPTQPIGGVIVAGTLIYDNREWLADRGREAIDAARWAGDTLADGGQALVEQAAEAAGDAAGAVSDAAAEAAASTSDALSDAWQATTDRLIP